MLYIIIEIVVTIGITNCA